MSYDFAGLRLDAQRRRLLRIDNGEPVALTTKAFDVLLMLVEARGQVVGKQALLDGVWGRVIVEENNLERHISMLRRALGERAGENRFIATVSGQGYRFVAPIATAGDAAPAVPVQIVAPAVVAPGASHRAAVLATLLACVLAVAGLWTWMHRRAAEPLTRATASNASLAVMPFANLTGEAGNDYLGEGIAEELIHRLSRSTKLKVPARTSTFAYRDRNVDVRQVARDLDVAYVLEGSIRGSGDQVRVTVQLIDATSGFHVWSQNYEREFDDVFALQDELAAAIVQRLAPGMQASGTSGVEAGPPTRNIEAYRAFLQANALAAPGEPTLAQALALYDRAIALDPQFARALAARAGTRMALLMFGVAGENTYTAAYQDAQRALLLEPTLPAAHAVLGLASFWRGRWAEGLRYSETAIELDPLDANLLASRSIMLASVGRLDEALATAQEAARVAPLAPQSLLPLAFLHSQRGEDAEAQVVATRALALGASPDVGLASLTLTQTALRSGRADEAARRVVANMPAAARAAGAEPVMLAVYRSQLDPQLKPAAAAALRRFAAITRLDDIERRNGTFLMTLHVLVGDLDSAFAVANAALDRYAETGVIGYPWLTLWSAPMEDFRADPRFAPFVERLHLPEYWEKAGPPQSCVDRNGQIHCGK